MVENPFKPQGGATKNSFLPEEYVAAKAEVRSNILVLSLFAVVLAGVIGAFMVTVREKVTIERRMELVMEREKEAGQLKEQLKELERQRAQIMEKAEITSALFERVPRWTVLAEVTMRMPSAMRLDSLVLKSTRIEIKPPAPAAAAKKPPAPKSMAKAPAGKKPAEPSPEVKPKVLPPRFEYALTISGAADQNNDIADFLTSLKQSPALDKVEMTFIREAKSGDRDTRLFEVTATVRTSVDPAALSASLRDLVARRTEQLAKLEAEKQAKKQASGAPAPDAANAEAPATLPPKGQGKPSTTANVGGVKEVE
jgi:Tfp pilus assembly protein PilN